jgi:hypothetical protein
MHLSPRPYVLHVPPISYSRFDHIYFVNSKDCVILNPHPFLQVHSLPYIIYLWDLWFSQRRFRGLKSLLLPLCRCVSGSRCFESGYYGPSKRREPLTKRHSVLSQKIWILILQLVYT